MKDLSFRAPPQLAIAENATTPTGALGAEIWSTTASKKLVWNGSAWVSAMGGAGGSGSGDVVGPATSTAGALAVFSDATGKTISSAPTTVTLDVQTGTDVGTIKSLNVVSTTPNLGVLEGAEGTLQVDAETSANTVTRSSNELFAGSKTHSEVTDAATTEQAYSSTTTYAHVNKPSEEKYAALFGDADTFSPIAKHKVDVWNYNPVSGADRGGTVISSVDGSSGGASSVKVEHYESADGSIYDYHRVEMYADATRAAVNASSSPLDLASGGNVAFSVTSFGELTTGPLRNPGTAGQVFTSGGPGQPAAWAALPAGGSGDMAKATYDTDNDGKVDAAEVADSVPWAGITGAPSTFAPSAHAHAIADVTGLQAALDGKQAAGNYEPQITKSVGYAKWNGSAWVFANETYLQSFTETDPVFSASAASGITATNITNWNSAYGWGNHASAGYLTTSAAALAYQPLDADLTSWAGIAPSSKQDALVSGTNIKTVNGQSVLGSGDLVIAGGSGSGDVVGPASSVANALATFADTTGKVIQEATYFDTPAISTPAAPAAGDLRWFARSRAGRILPHVVGPSDINVALQPALFGNSIFMWLPGTGTTLGINFGTSFTARNSGTSAAQAHPTRAATNAMTSLNRATFGTGTTATGASGVQSSATVAWLGNAAGLGGFFFFARFGIETFASDMRAFVGLSTNNAAMAADPGSWPSTIGIGKNSGTSTWRLIGQEFGSSASYNTGVTVTAGQILDLTMFAAPNTRDVIFRLTDAVTGAVLVDNYLFTVGAMPASNTFMYMQAHCQSVTGTTAKLLTINRMYCESDL